MELKNVNSLEVLIRKHGHGSQDKNISFGIRPSGMIHLGNMVTMALAAGFTNRVGSHRSKLNITVCDLDIPDEKDWNTRGNGFVRHYKDLPDPSGAYSSLSDRSFADVGEFLEQANKMFRVPFDIKPLSEVQRDPNFRIGLKRVLENDILTDLIMPNRPSDTVDVYPLCQNCGTSYTSTEKGKSITYCEGIIHTYCSNPECDVEDYSVDVLNTDKDLAVHFFIDPLRDSVVEPYADVHVFGGDYVSEHGENRVPKINKISEIVRNASGLGISPDFLLGPVIYAREGGKMSKRLNNGLDLNHLKSTFGTDYVKRIIDFTMGIVSEGYNHIDYPVIESRLLSK